jgi:hypothetical protein
MVILSRRMLPIALAALALAGCDAATPSGSPTPGGSPAAASSIGPAPSPSSAAPSSAAPASPSPGRTSPGLRIEGVTLVRSGGIAGLADTIEVRPDGRWWRGDRRGATKRTGKLNAAQAAQLQKLVMDPRLLAEADQARPGTTNCRDAFSYLLVARHQLIRYTQCPGEGKPPEVTMQIAALLLDVTAP